MNGRTASILALTIAVAIGATCVFAANAVASRIDFAHVAVRDHDSNVSLVVPVPASMVDVALTLQALECAPEELHQIRTALRSAGRELAAAEDFTLLEVHDRNEHVLLRKEGDKLLLSVESPDATVRIAIPQRVIL